MKINDDAMVLNESLDVVEMVCRDFNEAFLGASSFTFNNIHNPITLEALTVREALTITEDLYVQKFQEVSACKTVVNGHDMLANGRDTRRSGDN